MSIDRATHEEWQAHSSALAQEVDRQKALVDAKEQANKDMFKRNVELRLSLLKLRNGLRGLVAELDERPEEGS